MTLHLRHRSAALAAAVLLLVTACSSSEGSDGTATSTTKAGGTTGTTGTTKAPPTTGKALDRYADYETVSYDEPSHWVCRPDTPDDICHGDLDATLVAADGTLTEEPFTAAEDPTFDCFYVYPTISRDETPLADWDASPEEEGFVTVQQAARLRSQCRVFAPVYRQVSLSGLSGRINSTEGAEEIDWDKPYQDVADAFKTYMAEDNEGRPFVVIGHSQGAGMLNQLIKDEIDPNEDVRDLLVSAYLAGGTVAVPEGETVGGDFENVPLCTRDDEAGCVLTWATFRSTSPPPPDALFGKPRSGDGVAGCVNPADIAGGEADLDGYFPADATSSILSALGVEGEGKAWTDGSTGEISTPFVHLTDLTSGTCASSDGFNYLSVTAHPDPAGARADDITGDLSPQWGLHLVDVSLVMGDIVARVGEQAEAQAGG